MSDRPAVPVFLASFLRRRRSASIALMVVTILFVLILVTLLPIWSGGAAANFNLPADLHARTTADYSKDPLGTSHPAVNLGIIEAVLQDDNPFASDIDERLATMTQGISMPIPTSTRMQTTGSREPTTPPMAETAALLSTDSPTPLSFFTWTAAPGLTSSAGAATLPPTRTVTLPPGVTPSITLTPSRTPTLPPGVIPSSTATPTITLTSAPVVCETYPTTGFVAVQDTWIDAERPSVSNENAPKLEIEPGTREKNALIQFDLSSITAGSTVQSAILYLNVTKTSSYTLEFREIFTEWGENVTWATQPDYDFSLVSAALELNPSQGGNCVRSAELDTGLVEYWIDNPDLNFGLMLMAADGIERTDYSSSESNRPPRLVVRYTQ